MPELVRGSDGRGLVGDKLEMTATWTANSNVPAPTDEVRRSYYRIPVVVSNAMTENTGLLGDFRGGAKLYQTDGIRLDCSESTYDPSTSATDWGRNLIRFRAEGRFALGVLRTFAFIQINLAGTGS